MQEIDNNKAILSHLNANKTKKSPIKQTNDSFINNNNQKKSFPMLSYN